MSTPEATAAHWPEIGWCHHCETVQFLRDAPWLDSPYAPGVQPCCVICRENEPWDFGVVDATGEWVRTPIDGRRGWFMVKRCGAEHAERQDSLYPGDCDCPAFEVEYELVVDLRCRDCHVFSTAIRSVPDCRGRREWHFEGERCAHGPDQEVAAMRAAINSSGRSHAGPVSGTLRLLGR